MRTTCNCETPEPEKSGLVVVQPKASTSTWAIDRVHSTAQFKVKHMMISNVLGEFTSIAGVLERDENDVSKSKSRASTFLKRATTGRYGSVREKKRSRWQKRWRISRAVLPKPREVGRAATSAPRRFRMHFFSRVSWGDQNED